MRARTLFGLALALLSSEAHAQLAVVDSTNAVNFMVSIEKLQAQVETLEATYRALSGARGLANALNNPELRQYLPADWARVYDSATNGGYEGISGTLRAIGNAERLRGTGSVDEQIQRVMARSANAAATDKAVGVQAFAGTRGRLTQIESLMELAATTRDQKAILEVQARIASEQAAIQVETTKLQLIAMLQRAEERLIAEQKAALARKILSNSNTGMPSCCSSR
jgi:type IV secretion system protein VirB5